MGATEEQMQLLSNAGVTHVSYILILYSISFLLFLCKFRPPFYLKTNAKFHSVVNVLLHIYAVHAFTITPQPSVNTSSSRRHAATGSQESGVVDMEVGYAKTNGHTKLNGNMNGGMNGSAGMDERERRRVRDAEEFELDALISDEEDEEGGARNQGAVRA